MSNCRVLKHGMLPLKKTWGVEMRNSQAYKVKI